MTDLIFTPTAEAEYSSSKEARNARPMYDFSKRHRANEITATTPNTSVKSVTMGMPTSPIAPLTYSVLSQTTDIASPNAKVPMARYMPFSRRPMR